MRVRGSVPPLELLQTGSAGLTATRVLLLMEEKAQLDLLQVVTAQADAAHSHVLEVHLGQEACLNHGLLALGDGSASLLAHLAVAAMRACSCSHSACCRRSCERRAAISDVLPKCGAGGHGACRGATLVSSAAAKVRAG